MRRVGRPPARRWIALVALAALLSAPLFHGSLGHASDARSGALCAAGPLGGPHVAGADVCSLCLASGQARTLFAARAPLGVGSPAASHGHALAQADAVAPADVDTTRAAPRAPPRPA